MDAETGMASLLVFLCASRHLPVNLFPQQRTIMYFVIHFLNSCYKGNPQSPQSEST